MNKNVETVKTEEKEALVNHLVEEEIVKEEKRERRIKWIKRGAAIGGAVILGGILGALIKGGSKRPEEHDSNEEFYDDDELENDEHDWAYDSDGTTTDIVSTEE